MGQDAAALLPLFSFRVPRFGQQQTEQRPLYRVHAGIGLAHRTKIETKAAGAAQPRHSHHGDCRQNRNANRKLHVCLYVGRGQKLEQKTAAAKIETGNTKTFMPLYEYHCDSCGQNFERLQRFSDDPLTVHEACGSGPVHRLISTSALQFKGTGWYITDYKKSNSSNPSKESGKESKSDGGGSASSDASSTKSSGDSKSSSDSKPAAPASSSDGKSKN